MFPHPNRPDRPAHAWLDALRHGLDLLVACATLRDAEAPPESDETPFAAGISWPRAAMLAPATAAGRRRAAERAGADIAQQHVADGAAQHVAERAEQHIAQGAQQHAAHGEAQHVADPAGHDSADGA